MAERKPISALRRMAQGSHSPLVDRKARFPDIEREYIHVVNITFATHETSGREVFLFVWLRESQFQALRRWLRGCMLLSKYGKLTFQS